MPRGCCAYPVNRGVATVEVDGVVMGDPGVIGVPGVAGVPGVVGVPGVAGGSTGGGTASTSGPVTSHTEREMDTSPFAITPARCTWIAVTVIVLIEPTTSVRVCSFNARNRTFAWSGVRDMCPPR